LNFVIRFEKRRTRREGTPVSSLWYHYRSHHGAVSRSICE
jgi:hypothetical protein